MLQKIENNSTCEYRNNSIQRDPIWIKYIFELQSVMSEIKFSVKDLSEHDYIEILSLKDTRPQNRFRQVSIVLFGDLSPVSGSFKNWWIVVYILNMDDDRRVVLLQVIRSC